MRRTGLQAILFALCMPEPAMAQSWFTEFRPDPRCAPVLDLATNTTSDAAAPGGLVVAPISMRTGKPLLGSWVLVSAPSDSSLASPLRSSRIADSSGHHRFDGLPAGAVTVVVRLIGYLQARHTVMVRAGAVDSIAIPLREGLGEQIRCAPPGFRRDGQPACVTDPDEANRYLDLGRDLAGPERMPGLGRFGAGQVTLVHDERVCERAGTAYGRGQGLPRRVVVVRLGASGYLVIDPFEPDRAGEFETSYVFDRHWKLLVVLAG